MRTRSLGMAALAVLTCAAVAQAGPLQLSDVPADAVWVAHANVDAMRSSQVVTSLYNACNADSNGKIAEMLGKIADKTGIDPRSDLHSLTLYNSDFVPHQGVMIVRSEMSKSKLVEMAKMAPGHKTVNYRDHEIYTWTEKKGGKERQAAGVIAKPGVLVLASSVDLARQALDVLDGRKKGLQPGQNSLAAEVPDAAVFLARARDINTSPLGKLSPLCSQLRDFDYAEGEQDGQWAGHVVLVATDREVADRAESVLEGLTSLFWLQAKAAPKVRQLLGQIDVGHRGEMAWAEFEAPAKQVADAMPSACELLKKLHEEHMAHRAMWEHERAEHEHHGEAGQKAHEAKKPAKPQHEVHAAEKKPDKKAAEKAPGEKQGKPKQAASGKSTQSHGMRRPTARQGTAVLGVVAGEPLEENGAEVVRVWPDSPAERAGLQSNDLIVKVDGKEVDSPEALRAAVLRHEPGEKITLTIRRGGEEKQLDVTLAGGDTFASRGERSPIEQMLATQPWLGVRLASGEGQGVKVAGVLPGSPAQNAGLQEGDEILSIDNTRVEAPAALQSQILRHKPGETVTLTILRDGSRKQVDVKLGEFGVWAGENRAQLRDLFKELLEGQTPQAQEQK